MGTGSLIGTNLILTNNHVIDCVATARKAQAIFFHADQSERSETRVDLDPDAFFHSSPAPAHLGFKPITKECLDFTIVAIKPHAKIAEISHFAFSIFNAPYISKGIHANIIHHPMGGKQKISFRENLVKEVSLTTIHYTTATLSGSSGAPVMDDEGRLFALHRATCTHILKALLSKGILEHLLNELFPGTSFENRSLVLAHSESKKNEEFQGLCASIDGTLLYVFSEGFFKGNYYHVGQTSSPTSLFRLIEKQHSSPKQWALTFLNSRLEVKVPDFHKECNTATPIKIIHDSLKSAGVLPKIEARYAACQKNLTTLLKEGYLVQCASLPLVLSNTAFPIESFFTQLAIVSHKCQEKKEQEAQQRNPHEIEKDSLREIYSSLYAVEKPIAIPTLFDEREKIQVNKVLILGRAGIGKSTLCQKIVYDWASGALFQNFSSLFYLKLRDMNSLVERYSTVGNSHQWLSHMIAELCYGGAYQEKIAQILKTSEDVLLIFDGWDEASFELVQALEPYLRENQHRCLFTSRPGPTQKIEANFDLIVENMGFTEPQIKTYVQKFFNQTKSENLDLFLKVIYSQLNLLTIAHIPIQLQILCTLWQQGEREFPQTLTPLFSKITHYLFEWEQNKKKQEEVTPLKQLFLYQMLGEIALKGLESRKLTLSKGLIEGLLLQKALKNKQFKDITLSKLMRTGLLKSCGNNTHYFLHLTYQEYAIARYISSLTKNDLQGAVKQASFVQTYRYYPHFHLVIRMLAGCLFEDSQHSMVVMETFFDWLYAGERDLIGLYHTELVLACLNECRSEELEKRVWKKYQIAELVSFILKNNHEALTLIKMMAVSAKVVGQVFNHLDHHPRHANWFLNHLSEFLNHENAPLILHFIQKILEEPGRPYRNYGADNRYDGISEYLLYSFHRSPPAIFLALGEIVPHVEKKTLSKILKLVQTHLRSDYNTCDEGIQFVTKLAPYASLDQLPQIFALFDINSRLGTQDGGWIGIGLEVFIEKMDKALIPQVLNWTLNLLDKSPLEALIPLKMLIQDIDQQDIPRILNSLQIYLQSEVLFGYEYEESCSFLKAVITHAEKAYYPQIINWLERALQQIDYPYLRGAAWSVLPLLAGEVSINEIIGWYHIHLITKGHQAPETAIKALGDMVPVLGYEMLFALLRLQIPNDDAYDTLIKCMPHFKDDHLPQLLSFLQEGLKWYTEVKLKVLEVLGSLISHFGQEKIPKAMEWLLTASHDVDQSICEKAICILGENAARGKTIDCHFIN